MGMSESKRLVWKITHNVLALVFLVIFGFYFYESKILTFNSYTDIVSIVPTKNEFEGEEDIEFYIFMTDEDGTDEHKDKDLTVIESLRCDAGSTSGFEVISSQNVTIETDLLIESEDARTIISKGKDVMSYSQISSTLRQLAKSLANSDTVIYKGSLPNTTSECLIEYEFITFTERFGLEKTLSLQSYPFDYVWYYSPFDD